MAWGRRPAAMVPGLAWLFLVFALLVAMPGAAGAATPAQVAALKAGLAQGVPFAGGPRTVTALARRPLAAPLTVHRNPVTGTVRRAVFPPAASAFRLPQAADPLEHARLLAQAFLRDQRHLLRLADPDRELALAGIEADTLGYHHLRYTQQYKGIPVWPTGLNLHLAPSGFLHSLDGATIPTPGRRLTTRPVVSREQAFRVARHRVEGSEAATVDGQLIVFAYQGSQPRLAWKVRVQVSARADWLVVVDALNAAVLMAHNTVTTAAATGSGVDLLGQTRNLNLWETGGTYYLVDTSKDMYDDQNSQPPEVKKTRGAFVVLDGRNQPPTNDVQQLPDQLFHITSSDPNSGWLADGVSVASTLSAIYDYYKTTFGWTSFDNKGGTLTAIVRIGQNYSNAFMAPQISTMVFGDTDRFAVPDIVGHEFQHGVTANTARLVYQDQSGALNEAYSDIFGEMVEDFVRSRTGGHNDWVIGSELLQPDNIARSLADPHAYDADPGPNVVPYPQRMSEYIQMQGDHGGVHVNNTIVSHAFYLIAAGLPGAIGRDAAQRIFFRALRYHLTPNAQFVDARLAAIAAAEEIYANDLAQKEAVTALIGQAFDQVEITAGTPTPPPVEHTPVAGNDAAVFIASLDPDPNDYWIEYNDYLARCENDACDPLSQYPVALTRPAVAGDGSFAVFVDYGNDLCSVPTDGSAWESCLGFQGFVHSVAMSPDGDHWAFVLLDQTTFEPENKITLLDRQPDGTFSDRTVTLQAPVFDGVTIDAVLSADALDFSTDGRTLYYDALTVLRTPENEQVAVYAIYALDIASGRIFGVLPPVADKDVGYPAVAQTSDRRLTFDVYDFATMQSTVMAADLATGNLVQVATVSGYGIPGFNGDDTYLFYTRPGATNEIWAVPLGSDHLTPAGAEAKELDNAAFGVVYRRGAFTAPAPHLAVNPATVDFADTASGATRDAAVTVANDGTADLRLLSLAISGSDAAGFRLAAGPCGNALLRPGQSCTATVTFAPQDVMAYQAELTVSSDNGATVTVPLSGTGTTAVVRHRITVTVDGAGAVDPAGVVEVVAGADQTFTFQSAAGHHLAEVVVDGVAQAGPPASYTFQAVNADHTLEVRFAADAPPTYTITVTTQGSGVVVPGGPVTVTAGADQTFTFQPAAGQHVAEVLVDGVTQAGPPASYTFQAVAADHALEVHFAADQLQRKGDVDGDTALTVGDGLAVLRLLTGQEATVTVAADVDGDQAVGLAEALYALSRADVRSGTSHTITAGATGSGTIFPAGTVTVVDGQDQTFSFHPATGFHLDHLEVDGNQVAAAAGYTFSKVTGDHTITAVFVADEEPPASYTITAAAGPHGAIDPAGVVTVTAGTDKTFTFTPENGYQVAEVLVNGQAQGAQPSYTFTNLQGDATISVTFKEVGGTEPDGLALLLSEAAGGRYDAEALIDELLDIAARAAWTASEQTGVLPTLTGTLTQQGDTMNFLYQAGPADRMVVVFSNGKKLEIRYDPSNLDGYTDGAVEDFLLSHRLDFTVVSDSGLNLHLVSTTWPVDSSDPVYGQPTIHWQRRLTGTYPDGSRPVTLDLVSQGRLLRSDPSASRVFSKQLSSLTGTATSSLGTVQVNETLSGEFSHDSVSNQEVKQFTVSNDSTVSAGGETYGFNGYQVNWIMGGTLNQQAATPFVVLEAEKWVATGQVVHNGQVHGTIGFDQQPVNNTLGPAVVLRLGDGTSQELFRPIP